MIATSATSATDELIRISDLHQGNIPADVAANLDAVNEVLDWSENYLCKPHPELGRKGAVCPFVKSSMKKDLFYLSVYAKAVIDRSEITPMMREFGNFFLQAEPTQGPEAIFKSLLVIFPNVSKENAPEIIDAAQRQLIEEFAPKGIMVGEFHPATPNKVGLWNREFRPLYCPQSMLVIRHMVPFDILFLKNNKITTEAYIKYFGDKVPPNMQEHMDEAIERFNL